MNEQIKTIVIYALPVIFLARIAWSNRGVITSLLPSYSLGNKLQTTAQDRLSALRLLITHARSVGNLTAALELEKHAACLLLNDGPKYDPDEVAFKK